MSIFDLLDQFADAERKFTATRFLAPCIPGARISARVQGMIYTFRPQEADFEGWAIWQADDPKRARMVDEADFFAVDEYLNVLRPLPLRLAFNMTGKTWMAFPSNGSDARQRWGTVRPVPVHLVDNAAAFEQVIARWDGAAFWFQEVDRREDPEIAEQLSRALADETEPDALRFGGLTPEMRSAYSLNWFQKMLEDEAEEMARLRAYEAQRAENQRRAEREARRFAERQKAYGAGSEKRLRQALRTAGGDLRSARDQGETWLVNWQTGSGERHTSVISKKDLTVVSAGVCLAGHDNLFDLESLVAVVEQRPEWS